MRLRRTLALAALLAACAPYTGARPRILTDYQSDLDQRNPERDADAAWSRGERRFAAVAAGYGMMLPPLSQDEFNRCYAKEFGLRVVDRSSDIMGSGRMPPRGGALAYVARYNETVLKHLDPLTRCPSP